MSGFSKRPGDQLAELLQSLDQEVEKEMRAAMSPLDQKLDEVSRDALRLERDMTVPGSASSESTRIERLMSFIEEREF